ncbi:hypothetical protein V8C26DRAFT_301933 [Trichoderma gracile]
MLLFISPRLSRFCSFLGLLPFFPFHTASSLPLLFPSPQFRCWQRTSKVLVCTCTSTVLYLSCTAPFMYCTRTSNLSVSPVSLPCFFCPSPQPSSSWPLPGMSPLLQSQFSAIRSSKCRTDLSSNTRILRPSRTCASTLHLLAVPGIPSPTQTCRRPRRTEAHPEPTTIHSTPRSLPSFFSRPARALGLKYRIHVLFVRVPVLWSWGGVRLWTHKPRKSLQAPAPPFSSPRLSTKPTHTPLICAVRSSAHRRRVREREREKKKKGNLTFLLSMEWTGSLPACSQRRSVRFASASAASAAKSRYWHTPILPNAGRRSSGTLFPSMLICQTYPLALAHPAPCSAA